MAKNFFKTLFNSNKEKVNINFKNTKLKLNQNQKLSNIVSNIKSTDESNILQQKQQNQTIDNMLLNFYSHKEDNNNIINNFLEKIKKLNKKFYTSCEKYIATKNSMDKLSDDLFLNLFQQIDCYAGEIQKLNEKIVSIDNKENKNIIKNLKKEILENKEKIRNYEIKLKEKTAKEDKLLKEIQSYKRRIIFLKNRININLIPRNVDRRPIYKKESQETNDNIRNISKNNLKNEYIQRRRYTQRSKSKKIPKLFSPSPGKRYRFKKNESFISNESNKEQPKRTFDSYLINSTITNTVNNTLSNWKNNMIKDFEKNLITVNKDSKGIFSDGENENNNKALIKINRKIKFKESIMVPSDKMKANENTSSNITKINIEDNFESKNKKDELTPKKIEFNKYSPEMDKKLDNLFEKLNDSKNSIFSDKDENYYKLEKDLDKKMDKIGKINKNYYSTIDIKKTKTEKKIQKALTIFSPNKKKISTVIKGQKVQTNTNKKLFPTKKVFKLPSKKFMKSNLKNTTKKYNTINNNIINNSLNNNTMESNNNNTFDNHNQTFESIKANSIDNITDNLESLHNNTIDNNNNNVEEKTKYKILKSKTVKFKEEKDPKYNITTSESENNENFDLSSKDLSINVSTNKINKNPISTTNKIINKTSRNHIENASDTLNKDNLTKDVSSTSINSKLDIKNKNIIHNPRSCFSKKKTQNRKTKINNSSNKEKTEQINKEKEVSKILKEMYEDNSSNIEMLTTQEEQIKYLLNLIDLNDS